MSNLNTMRKALFLSKYSNGKVREGVGGVDEMEKVLKKLQKNAESNRKLAPSVLKRLVLTTDDDAVSLSSDSS